MRLILFFCTFVFFIACVRECLAKTHDPLIASPCVDGVTRRRSQIEADRRSWDDYPFNRSDLIEYMKLGFDVNDDQHLSPDECKMARDYYFTPFELQWGETCATVFARCDCDGDGLISQWDFENSYMTCLRRGLDGARIQYLIGGRIASKGAYKGKIMPSEGSKYPDIKGD